MILNQLDTELAAVSRHLRQMTVEIDNRDSGGSGMIWSPEGLIVTNSHVVRGINVRVRFATGNAVMGSVIARDRQRDLAIIKVEAENLPTPILSKTEALRPGEIVLAMGSPWGFSGTLTTGVIHSLCAQGTAKAKFGGIQPTSLSLDPTRSIIVADIRLAPGNSGGVLANVRGEVLGINTAIFQGLALAISAEHVAAFVETVS